MPEQAPYSGFLDEGVYEISFPETITVNNSTYHFVSWRDGDSQPTKTITLTSDTSLSILYLPEQVYDNTAPSIH